MYRRILGPVYDNEKENWRILTNKEIYSNIKKPTITEKIRLHRLRWFGHVQRMEENRMVSGEEWQEKVYDREEWKRLLRTARNHRILYMPMD